MAAPSSAPRTSATSAPSPRPRTSPARAAPYPPLASSTPAPAAPLPLPKLPTTSSLSRTRYTSTTRENMNCKSCRKRKIKCSRTRPSCNACDVFRCECLYDAVPKKRGPKTEVLEELLKRIDGLERRLEEGPRTEQQVQQSPPGPIQQQPLPPPPPQPSVEMMTPSPAPVTPPVVMEAQGQEEKRDWRYRLVDVFFSRVNGRPYGFFHEPSFRAELAAGRVKEAILNSVCAASVRYVPAPELPDSRTTFQHAEEFANLARSQVDADEPSLENLQAMLLLSMTFYAMGQGKKAWMQMGPAIRMTLGLDLHRELPPSHPGSPLYREIRRRVFWTCYFMDRFTVCGSLRPPQLSDRSISLRLPSDESSFAAGTPSEGPFFSPTGQYPIIPGAVIPNSNRLVDIVRILGSTIQYTQSGGIKGDNHFPWHSASNLSRIRASLNTWASSSPSSPGPSSTLAPHVASLIPHTKDSTALFLARSIWHVIHCLLYRPFLPTSLEPSPTSGSSTHQSWQTEATVVSFHHANSLVDLISTSSANTTIEWPAFAGFALATAATVLIHGVFYHRLSAVSTSAASEFAGSEGRLDKVIQKLGELRGIWACMAQHLYTLRILYLSHEHLVTHHHPSSRPSVFQLDDFFDRYSGCIPSHHPSASFEASHVPFDAPPADPDSLSSPPQQVTTDEAGIIFDPAHQTQWAFETTLLQPTLAYYPHSTSNDGDLTDYLFPPDLGLGWITDWPSTTHSPMPTPASNPILHPTTPPDSDASEGVVRGHWGGGGGNGKADLGFRRTLEGVEEGYLPIAQVAAEQEEDADAWDDVGIIEASMGIGVIPMGGVGEGEREEDEMLGMLRGMVGKGK